MKAYKKAKIGGVVEKMRPKTAEQHRSTHSLQTGQLLTNLTETELQTYVYRTLESKDIYQQDGMALFKNSGYESIENEPSEFIRLMSFESNSIPIVDKERNYNAFTNYSRPIQNTNEARLDKESLSIQLSTVEYGGMVTQGIINKNYLKKSNNEKEKKSIKKGTVDENTGYYRTSIACAQNDNKYETQVIARMISQNVLQDVVSDFRYWNDPADAFKELEEGSLLPLWDIPAVQPGMLITANWLPGKIDQYLTVSLPNDATHTSGSIIRVVDVKDANFQKSIKLDHEVLHLSFNPRNPSEVAVATKNKLGYVNLSNLKVLWSDPVDGQILSIHITVEEDISGFFILASGTLQKWHLNNSNFLMDDSYSVNPFSTDLDFAVFSKIDSKLFLSSSQQISVHDIKLMETYQYNLFHDQPIQRAAFNSTNSEIFACFAEDWRISIWLLNVKQPIAVILSHSQVVDFKWLPYAPNKFLYLKRDGQVIRN